MLSQCVYHFKPPFGFPLGKPLVLGILNFPMHLAIAHTGPALRTPTHGAAMAGAMTRVTGPPAEAWRPQIQNGDTNSESIPNMYKVQRIDHANKNQLQHQTSIFQSGHI